MNQRFTYSIPAVPPPFRRTPHRPWLQQTSTVRRNLKRHPQLLRMNPLAGIMASHRNALGYRHASPHGDNLLFGITGNPSDLPHLSVHCSLLTGHSSYTFSAKEKDSETGLSYFGSRYYSSDLSVWLSVDPMAAKYPSLSPYVYCANNPVKLTDPDGRWIPGLDEDGNVTYTAEKGDNYRTFADQFYCYKKGKDNKLQDKSLEIFENAGYKGGEHAVVKEGDVITGKAVYDAMGSDVLKGDWSNMTDNQKAYQIKFAFDYGKKNNSSIGQDFAINLNDFFHGFSTGYSAMELNGVNIPIREGGSVIMTTVNITIWPKDRLVNRNGQIPIYWRSQATGENYRMHNYYSAINSSAGGKIPAITISF